MRRAVTSLCLLALLSCTDDRVTLRYGLEAGRRLEYRLTLAADIERTLSGTTRRQEVRASFRASQEVLSVTDEGATARMSLAPEELSVDGRPVEPGTPQGFTVQLAPDGRVVEIEETEGQPSEPLSPVGIERLLPRLRPVLPQAEVSTGDEWRSTTEFQDAAGRFAVAARSRLAGLDVVGGVPAALVRSTYLTPVDRRETLANALADVSGRDLAVQEAWFSLEGFLLRSTGDSVGRYRITFRPPGGEEPVAPVEGALVVRLHTEMALA